MLQIFKNTAIDFIAKRRIAYGLSALVILIGMASIVSNGGLKYGIDFAGGLALRLRFESPPTIGSVRGAISSLDIAGAEVQTVGDGAEILVRVPVEGVEGGDDRSDEILGSLKTQIDPTVSVLSADKVGPKVGAELKGQAIKAIVLALLAIVAYITLRFEFRFGIAAIVTLTHDVLVVVGLLMLLNREMSLPIVAALLTIVGYSLNDTIVVFDRIREDTKLMRRRPYGEVLNASINRTLSRTVITSVTTLIPVTTLMILGGSVIQDFALALLMGVLVGTYSSIFVASPVLFEWNERKPRAVAPVKAPRVKANA
ncbi:MAG: protein translocase subunit SecF [Gemmatimonadetes bacterium]|nr:protein translocase subunit SecF [Gemmatimonadota bacterium]